MKEYETLRNKAKFIKAVIDQTFVIKKVKKLEIARQLKAQKYNTQSELNAILKEDKKSVIIQSKDDQDQDGDQSDGEAEEVVPPGGVSPKEFDYLLTMPLWSLSDEKINELMETMQKKKNDYDSLKGTHVYELW